MVMLEIDVTHPTKNAAARSHRLKAAVAWILDQHGVSEGSVSVAVVDNPTIHALNREHLQHDYPTDVLSFAFHRGGAMLHGEIIVSQEMAAQRCAEFGWTVEDELLLYVIHGCLHLVGHDDHDPQDIAAMRAAESAALSYLKVRVPDTLGAKPGDPIETAAVTGGKVS